MRRIGSLLFLVLLIGGPLSPAEAQRFDEDNLGAVETLWPGVRFQLLKLERIPKSRLLATVRIFATSHSPGSGTLIGTKAATPDHVSKEDLLSARFAPRSFSLEAAEMVHEQTGRKYPTLVPEGSGRSYAGSEVLTTLLPGQAEVLTIQFALPPEANSEKQTASFLLPNAKGPITRVLIPPLESVEEGAAQPR